MLCYPTYLSTDHFSSTAIKLMRQAQLKKECDRIKIALKQCSWKTCGGVEEFCTNYQTGDTLESINAFIHRK